MFTYDRNRVLEAERLLQESERMLQSAQDSIRDAESRIARNGSVPDTVHKLRTIRQGLQEDLWHARTLRRTLEHVRARYEGADNHLTSVCDRIPPLSIPGRKSGPARTGRVRIPPEEIGKAIRGMRFAKPDPEFWKRFLRT